MDDIFKAKTYAYQPVRYAHQKLDGHRVIVSGGKFLTRLGHNLVKHLRERDYPWLHRAVTASVNSTYDAELVTELGAHRVKSWPDDLKLVGFATKALPDDATLIQVETWFESLGLDFAPYHRLQNGWSVADLLNTARRRRCEGWILKNGNYQDWYKIKVVETQDLYVAGVNPGRGKYNGLIGSLVLVDEFNSVRADCSGMTDAEREELTSRWVAGRLLGRCVEIKHNGHTSRGRFRHPQFLRMRDDEK